MHRNRNRYIFMPEKTRRRGPGCLILALSFIFAAIVLALLTNAATNRQTELITEKVPIMSLNKKLENFTVLEITDLHGDERGLDGDLWRTLLYGKNFSAVTMTGDMVGKNGDYTPMVSLIRTIRQIKADVPVYFIAGDEDPAPVMSDPHGDAEVLAEWVRAAQMVGGTYLDRPVAQIVDKQTVWFTPEYLYSVDVKNMVETLTRRRSEMETSGDQYDTQGGASYRALCYQLDTMTACDKAIQAMKKDDLQIGLTHVPLETDYVRERIEWVDETAAFSFRRLSLMLAGHYCGGAWRLGALGPLYVPGKGWFPGDAGILGMQRINSLNQYISGGIDTSDIYPMPGRMFNAPTVTMLIYTAKIV